MRTRLLLATLIAALLATLPVHAKELADLKVMYIGKERSGEFVPCLAEHVASVVAVDRSAFDPADAADFDVVLLDWPQGEESEDMKNLVPPLGPREAWNRPTVLLGSAGLLLAVSWEARGGVGCTCMDPLAYDLREHEIFEQPFKIDRGKMISIPTPKDFKSEIKESTVQVLPLVDAKQGWRAGWCSYSDGFEKNPDVEFFCGGVNVKTPTAAGLWRQGNLLHFGFEQSPTEMNEVGRQLLLNSIAYISRFSEDRPIAITPSVFARPTTRSRATLTRWLKNPDYPIDFVEGVVSAALWEQLSDTPDREVLLKWANEQGKFLRPDSDQKWELDSDLVALGTPFDQPAFFEKCLVDLAADNAEHSARAVRLLKRYVPCGPQSDDAGEWKAWHTENLAYLFPSDEGNYRWYIDPLAKKRGLPTSELRGPKRAD